MSFVGTPHWSLIPKSTHSPDFNCPNIICPEITQLINYSLFFLSYRSSSPACTNTGLACMSSVPRSPVKFRGRRHKCFSSQTLISSQSPPIRLVLVIQFMAGYQSTWPPQQINAGSMRRKKKDPAVLSWWLIEVAPELQRQMPNRLVSRSVVFNWDAPNHHDKGDLVLSSCLSVWAEVGETLSPKICAALLYLVPILIPFACTLQVQPTEWSVSSHILISVAAFYTPLQMSVSCTLRLCVLQHMFNRHSHRSH